MCDYVVHYCLGDEDYIAVSQTVIFEASVNCQTVSVPITNDDIFELNEIFNAVISEITDDPDVEITQPMSAVEILNDDSKSPSSKVIY